MTIKRIARVVVFSSIAIFTLAQGALCADTKESADVIVDKARIVVEEMLLSKDSSIPTYLIEKCSGLAIIPDMIKGGFVVGGSYGNGVVLARRGGTWKGPAFIYLGAGSVGFQIGVQSTDLLLVIVGERAMESFLRNQFKLGADVAIAAGPIGAQATAAAEIMLKGGIFSYSRAKGLFAGVSLEGAAIGTSFDHNRAYYRERSTGKDILFGDLQPPPKGQQLIDQLKKIK